MEVLKNGPACDVTIINVDLRLWVLKPYHAKVLTDLYLYSSSDNGKTIIKAEWKAAGIGEGLNNSRKNKKNF